MNFPPLPQLPEPIRGQSFTIVRGCWAGDLGEGHALLARLTDELPPLVDMWRDMPFSEVATISNDPVDPLPGIGTGGWLTDLDAGVARALAGHTFATDGPPLLMFSEVRHVGGGAVARGDRSTTTLGHRDLGFVWHALGVPMDDAMAEGIAVRLDVLRTALAEHDTGRVHLNFIEGEERRARTLDALDAGDARALRQLKHELDPDDVLRFGVAYER